MSLKSTPILCKTCNYYSVYLHRKHGLTRRVCLYANYLEECPTKVETQRASHAGSLNSRALIICNIFETCIIILPPVLLSRRPSLAWGLSSYLISASCQRFVTKPWHTPRLSEGAEALPCPVRTRPHVANCLASVRHQHCSTCEGVSIIRCIFYIWQCGYVVAILQTRLRHSLTSWTVTLSCSTFIN